MEWALIEITEAHKAAARRKARLCEENDSDDAQQVEHYTYRRRSSANSKSTVAMARLDAIVGTSPQVSHP